MIPEIGKKKPLYEPEYYHAFPHGFVEKYQKKMNKKIIKLKCRMCNNDNFYDLLHQQLNSNFSPVMRYQCAFCPNIIEAYLNMPRTQDNYISKVSFI